MLKEENKNFIRKVFHYCLKEYRTLKITGLILFILCFLFIIIQDNTSLEQLMNKNEKPEMTTETSSYSNNIESLEDEVSELKLKAGKCSFTASWNEVLGADGYQIQYTKEKKFSHKSNKKYVGKAKITIKKLLKKKKYYVRVRDYFLIEGKKIYGSWCERKRIVTK